MRVLSFCGMMSVMLMLAGGCAQKANNGNETFTSVGDAGAVKAAPPVATDAEADLTPSAKAPAKGAVRGGGGVPEKTEKAEKSTGDARTDAPKSEHAVPLPKAPAGTKSREAAGAVAMLAPAPKKGAWKPKPTPEPQSGRLTAGSFDDNLFPDAFRRFASKMGQESSISNLSGKLFGRRLIVTVKGKDGRPLGNARVHVAGNDGQASVDLTTRSDGRVIFVASWDNVDGDLSLTVTPPDGSPPVTKTVEREAGRIDVALPTVAAPLPKNLERRARARHDRQHGRRIGVSQE